MTKEEAKQWIPILQAYADGRAIQNCSMNGKIWYECNDPIFSARPSEYRIKPEPKLRPWRQEEVPVGAIIRQKGCEGYCSLILGTTPKGVDTLSSVREYITRYFQDALDRFEWSKSTTGPWLPCGVEDTP